MTEKQKRFLEFIKHFTDVNGFPPTVREIAKGVGVSSPSTVKAMIDRLIDKGVLKKDALKARSLEITDKRAYGIPLVGRIKAGYPVTSEENIEKYIFINGISKNCSDCFFLKVTGESMIDKGIFDGDLVLIRPQKELLPGETGAFRINNEITLKTFIKIKSKVILRAENKNFKDIVVNKNDDFEIIGKSVAVIRDEEGIFDNSY